MHRGIHVNILLFSAFCTLIFAIFFKFYGITKMLFDIPTRGIDKIHEIQLLRGITFSVIPSNGKINRYTHLITTENYVAVTEPPALRDLAFSGVDVSLYISNYFQDCKVSAWVIDRNAQPFRYRNSYNSVEMFSDDLRTQFHSNYHLAKSTPDVDIYICSKTG